MAKKKKSSKTVSSSITQTDLSLTGAENISVENLLGGESCPQLDEPRALLRLMPTKLNPDLRKRLGVHLDDGELMLVGSHPVILGPLAIDHLHSLAVVGAIASRDQILLPFDRWRLLVDVYPDLKGLILEGDELTHTATETMTEALSENTSSYKSGEDAEEPLRIEEESLRPLLKSQVASAESRTATNTLRTGKRSSPKKKKMRWDFRWVLSGAAAIGLLLFWGYPDFHFGGVEESDSLSEKFQGFRRRMDEERILSLPQNLRPLPIETLYKNDDALMRKLRPFLQTYENGSIYFSDDDLRVIRGVASPASSSLRARVMATNLLASYFLSKARFEEARELIKPMLIAAPADMDTLINASILELESGNLRQAREYAASAQRLCHAQLCWVPFSILGLIEAKLGRYKQSHLAFQNALATMQNILVMGMWLNAMAESATDARKNMQQVLQAALWVDPDRHLDSPLAAPLALHWIYAESTDGFRSALTLLGPSLSAGKKSYIQWLLGRNFFVPAMESIDTVARELKNEDDVQSQVLYALALKEQGDFDRASQVMNRTLPLIEFERIGSSWPWTLAGNIHEEREVLDQAILSYQGAISRDARDVNAVYGLAISLRDKEDYSGALEKNAEALRLDPTYVPALLHLRRLEWHRMRGRNH